MPKVLVAVASEIDGHAGADAIQTTIAKYDKETIKAMLIKKLADDPKEVKVTDVWKDKNSDVWHAYGETYGYSSFAAMIAPIRYVHISTATG